MKNYPVYKCFKEVNAFQIKCIDSEGIQPIDESLPSYVVMPEFLKKHAPERGGYIVFYADGYVSYSPQKAFEEGYTIKPKMMSFGEAIHELKAGRRVARAGWNGLNQFVFLVKAVELQNSLRYGYGEYLGEPVVKDTLAIKTTTNEIQIGWLASQTDMLAEDWLDVG